MVLAKAHILISSINKNNYLSQHLFFAFDRSDFVARALCTLAVLLSQLSVCARLCSFAPPPSSSLAVYMAPPSRCYTAGAASICRRWSLWVCFCHLLSYCLDISWFACRYLLSGLLWECACRTFYPDFSGSVLVAPPDFPASFRLQLCKSQCILTAERRVSCGIIPYSSYSRLFQTGLSASEQRYLNAARLSPLFLILKN